MTLMAQRLKDVALEGVLAYSIPREYVVNMLGRCDDASSQAALAERLSRQLNDSQLLPEGCLVHAVEGVAFL